MSSLRGRNTATPRRGSDAWFHKEIGLNNYGYIPGGPKHDRNSLPKTIANEGMCKLRWGHKKGGKFLYAKPDGGESPRQRYRIERLYQLTHQKPIGKTLGFGIAFGRGLIAEKLGHAVDWASYAAKQCSRGARPFETTEEFKRRCDAEGKWFPENEVRNLDLDENTLEGAADDWEVNRHLRKLDMKKVKHYDLKDALPTIPSQLVRKPLYKQGGI